jgi:hypothetical protein
VGEDLKISGIWRLAVCQLRRNRNVRHLHKGKRGEGLAKRVAYFPKLASEIQVPSEVPKAVR